MSETERETTEHDGRTVEVHRWKKELYHRVGDLLDAGYTVAVSKGVREAKWVYLVTYLGVEHGRVAR